MSAGISHSTIGYNEVDYWTTIRPHETRSLTRGYQARTPFTRSTELQAFGRLQLPNQGMSINLSGDVWKKDTTLQHLPDRRNNYLVYIPVLSYDERGARTNIYLNYSKNKSSVAIGGNLNYTRSSIDPINPTDFRNLNSFLYIFLRYKPSTWLYINPEYIFSQTQQFSKPINQTETSTKLIEHSPRLAITLRGKQLSARLDGDLSLGQGIPTLFRLDARITYQHPTRPFELTLRTNDILNYNRSTFRSVNFSPGNLRATTFERLPGYVALIGKYTWGRGEK